MAKRRKLPNGIGSITKVPKTASGKPRLSPYLARLPHTIMRTEKKKDQS